MNWKKITELLVSGVASRLLKFEIARRFWNMTGWRRLSLKEAYGLVTVWTYVWGVAGEYWHHGVRQQEKQIHDLKRAGLNLFPDAPERPQEAPGGDARMTSSYSS